MRATGMLVFWMLAASASAQMLPPRGTLVLGAGRAGNWDTSIAITNVDPEPINVWVTKEFYCCSFCPCADFASATIAPFATFVVPTIPETIPSLPGPQAVYVLSAYTARAPVVSAVVTDGGETCERSMSLPGLSRSIAFAPGNLVFTGVNRDAERYANLIMTVDPPTGPPRTETDVRLGVRDPAGVEVGVATYRVTSASAVVAVDFLRELGVLSLEGGSVWLSVVPPSSGGTGTRFAAVITVVEPSRAAAIQGTRVPEQ